MSRIDRSAGQLWIGKQFDARNNSLNLIRLLLALVVLVHHSWPLSGSHNEPGFAGDTLGGWAIAGFFVVSGYLITASRYTHGLGDYLVHRVARIMPAFVVCLVVVAAVFAPIGYVAAKGNLDGFFGTGTTPLNYVFSNMGLKMTTYDVAGTPLNVPYAGAWNGSLWSLYYEFVCYLVVAVLGCFAFFRKSPWLMTAAFAGSVLVRANIDTVLPYVQNNFDFRLLFQLLPFFLGGAVVQVWKDRIGIHWLPAVLSILAAVLITAFVPGWGGAASAVFICYGILWISLWLPSPNLIKRNDVSYGLYIYAFPVQQLLAVYGIHELGLLPFTVLATVVAVPLAIASWLLVERPVMRRVRGRRKKAPSASHPEPAPVEASRPAAAAAAAAPTVLNK
ncbi:MULTISPECIES: acyltransferase [unclassified Arthrobacter]|uniref:acyltransferase family protein n=1 Tax=unclassified Arthrobacter TaxID=235627 RepID=UPI0024DFEAA6|nr:MULTISPECIES: acyltransferase [unclassified Arthrobacter]MCC9146463.1 acyltransferase [Arthrobacter sp. zg-Y919]MDK1277693.1 acyltransferase [Arthrobacter sp. zg.Y919]WIB02349.1 acyltransferase [Arthrobacter sp. zg-Y919]